MDFDLIVIGAGPAGSSAAGEAAQRGLRVCLLEKQKLPRHKTCGGGMPMVVGEELRDLAPAAFVESDVRFMRHTFAFREAAFGEVNPPGAQPQIALWMVQRAIFDNELAQRASRLGADLRDDSAVRSISADSGWVRVHLAKADETLTARHVIGADGANGITARAAGLRSNRKIAVGMDIEFPHVWRNGPGELRPDTLHLDYGAVKDGYAWIFPKANHLNIGAGLFRPRGSDGRGESGIREELKASILGYLDYFRLPYNVNDLRFHAHPLPLWNGREPLNTPDGRMLIAGDAAGMINPLFGDGILHAVRSGIIAAEVIAEGRPAEYTARVHTEIAPNFEAARRLAGPFYQFAKPIYRQIIRRPGATRAAARLLCGDALFEHAASRAFQILRRSLLPVKSSSL